MPCEPQFGQAEQNEPKRFGKHASQNCPVRNTALQLQEKLPIPSTQVPGRDDRLRDYRRERNSPGPQGVPAGQSLMFAQVGADEDHCPLAKHVSDAAPVSWKP